MGTAAKEEVTEASKPSKMDRLCIMRKKMVGVGERRNVREGGTGKGHRQSQELNLLDAGKPECQLEVVDWEAF